MKTGGVYLGFHTFRGRKFLYGNFRTTRVLHSQNTDCRKNEVFRQSQTHILRCASFCVFARLQLRHICIYEWHIGFAYRINRFGHMPDTVLPR